jgi:multidrug resistance efflux pump
MGGVMSTEDRGYPTRAERRDPAETRNQPQAPYRVQSGYSQSRQLRQAPRGHPPAHHDGHPSRYESGQMPRQALAERPATLQPAEPEPARRESRRIRRRTWPQVTGGALIAGACVAAAVWYVPHVMADYRRIVTGTVSSSGVIALNFAVSGQIGKMNVHLDQAVRRGQVLAAEYAPNADSVVTADKAAIAAEQAKITQLKASAAADPANASADDAQLAAALAQLASDKAQLASDRLKVADTEIIAPSGGIVVAANGQPGETVTSVGIRSYASDSRQQSTTQGPQFSLLPEGPQPVRRDAAAVASLPVIALRVSTAWQVIALIPEDSVSEVKPGQKVTIDVPTARIADLAGQVQQLIPTPVSTAQGLFYQAVITVTGRTAAAPMNGMAADIQLG